MAKAVLVAALAAALAMAAAGPACAADDGVVAEQASLGSLRQDPGFLRAYGSSIWLTVLPL